MEKKKVICFGANSFLAKRFAEIYGEAYDLIKVTRTGTSYSFDFEKDEQVHQLAASMPNNISGIVFFQGISPSVGLKDMTVEHFQRMVKVNLSTPTVLISALTPKMAKGCSVIFFSSVAQKKGSYDPAYGAAKSAMPGLIQSLANACPDFRFNCLALGLVEGSPVHLQMTDDFVERHKSRMFGRRLIQPGEVASMISQLLDGTSINRQEIFLDGGFV